MIKKNNDAFLKSIRGSTPIKNNNKIKKDLPSHAVKKKRTNTVVIKTEKINQPTTAPVKKKSFYTIEKTPINKRLKQGKIPVNKKIDLHGYSLIDAETFFFQTIKECYFNNLRCVLFVTGKGSKQSNIIPEKKNKLYYGKIRNNFYEWVTHPSLQKYILSYEGAGIQHGGDGAFFVYLRKNKF
tara:strand:+ start:2683 stop:3231 length:549 start_codon:yes stop_codon:yes gene_type:complete